MPKKKNQALDLLRSPFKIPDNEDEAQDGRVWHWKRQMLDYPDKKTALRNLWLLKIAFDVGLKSNDESAKEHIRDNWMNNHLDQEDYQQKILEIPALKEISGFANTWPKVFDHQGYLGGL